MHSYFDKQTFLGKTTSQLQKTFLVGKRFFKHQVVMENHRNHRKTHEEQQPTGDTFLLPRKNHRRDSGETLRTIGASLLEPYRYSVPKTELFVCLCFFVCFEG